MTSRFTLAIAAALFGLVALPTSSQAGGLDKIHDCLFGWTKHFHRAAPAKVEKKKVSAAKPAKKAAAMPQK